MPWRSRPLSGDVTHVGGGSFGSTAWILMGAWTGNGPILINEIPGTLQRCERWGGYPLQLSEENSPLVQSAST